MVESKHKILSILPFKMFFSWKHLNFPVSSFLTIAINPLRKATLEVLNKINIVEVMIIVIFKILIHAWYFKNTKCIFLKWHLLGKQVMWESQLI